MVWDLNFKLCVKCIQVIPAAASGSGVRYYSLSHFTFMKCRAANREPRRSIAMYGYISLASSQLPKSRFFKKCFYCLIIFFFYIEKDLGSSPYLYKLMCCGCLHLIVNFLKKSRGQNQRQGSQKRQKVKGIHKQNHFKGACNSYWRSWFM